MLFHSLEYLFLFLPAVAAGNAVLVRYAGGRAAQAWILAGSLFFYAYGDARDTALLAASILFNWAAARYMTSLQDPRWRLWSLRLAIAANLAFLGGFKYLDFFLRNFAPHARAGLLSSPLGISFFTLIQVMYLVDTYQGLNQANSLFDHASFVAFFPYVVSGPLARSREIVSQFYKSTLTGGRLDAACRGAFVFAMGLAKKVVVADYFAKLSDAGFAHPGNLSSLEAWTASICYALQLYFDFSGYSDMAVGSALLLGIQIPQNFDAPYRSRSVSEFWQRWHISLSKFITNYLYTPILLSWGKVTLPNSVAAVILTMAIAGLWHGADWTFVAWGVLHGCALAAHQVWKKKKMHMPVWAARAVTFLFVDLALVFFRAPSLSSAFQFLRAMAPHAAPLSFATLSDYFLVTPLNLLNPALLGIPLAFLGPSTADWARRFQPAPWTAAATAALLALSICFVNSGAARRFVYFAF